MPPRRRAAAGARGAAPVPRSSHRRRRTSGCARADTARRRRVARLVRSAQASAPFDDEAAERMQENAGPKGDQRSAENGDGGPAGSTTATPSAATAPARQPRPAPPRGTRRFQVPPRVCARRQRIPVTARRSFRRPGSVDLGDEDRDAAGGEAGDVVDAGLAFPEPRPACSAFMSSNVSSAMR